MFTCVAAAGDVSPEITAALVLLASDFSPRYEVVRADLVLIDVSGLGRLLGPPQEIATTCARVAHDRGLRVGIAIAATQTTAMLLALSQARHQAEERTPIVVRLGQEAAALAPLPLSLLADIPLTSAASDAAFLRRAATPRAAKPRAAGTNAAGTSTATNAATTSAAAARGAGRRRDVARAHPHDAPPGKTRGKRGRNSGWHYRLAPAPLPAEVPGRTAAAADSIRRHIVAGGGDANAVANANAAANTLSTTNTASTTNAANIANAGVRLTLEPPAAPTAREREAIATRLELLEILARWGLKTLGDFVKLPVIDVFERLGDAGVRLQQIARGQDARPLVHTPAEDPFEATFALEWPIDTLEPLSFVVTRLLDPLCARLERADRAAAALDTTLHLVNRERDTCRLELPTAIRDPKVLRTLILLDLESHPPTAAIDRVTITIHPTPGRIVQHSLLTRALPSPEQLSTLTARLTAIMGDARVGAPALVDTHRPEAFAMHRFAPTEQLLTPLLTPPTPAAAPAYRALRRFRHPIPAQVELQDGRPVRVTPQGLPGGAVTHAAGPWRTSGDWWNVGTDHARAQAGPWSRDEWDVSLRSGHVYHLHHEPAPEERWYIAGRYD